MRVVQFDGSDMFRSDDDDRDAQEQHLEHGPYDRHRWCDQLGIQWLSLQYDHSNEGTFPSVTRLSIRELCRFVALDESSRSLEEFVPIRGSTRVINFLLPFQPGMS